MSKKYYRGVSLPAELISFIEELIKLDIIQERYAYSSTADFFKDAARRRIESLLSLYPELKEQIDTTKVKD